MPYVTRHAKLILCVACVLTLATNARAATVVWTIDTAASSLGLVATGRAPVSGQIASLKIIQQGLPTPLASVTPTVSAKIQGQLITDTDFTSTITFLHGALIDGVVTGTFAPDSTGAPATSAPA